MVCRGGRQVGQATEPRIVALQLRSCYACRRAARNGLTGKGGRLWLWLCPSSRLELFPGLFRLLVSLDCAHDFLFGLLFTFPADYLHKLCRLEFLVLFEEGLDLVPCKLGQSRHVVDPCVVGIYPL